MRTIRTKVYKFEELSKEAQSVAIAENTTINVDFNWWESIYFDADLIGLKITGFDLDRNKNATGNLKWDAYQVAINIRSEHGVNTETYILADKFINSWDEAVKLHSDGIQTDRVEEGKEQYFDSYVNDLEADFLKNLLDEYANILQKESEYLQSEESIKEAIILNEYEFLSNGKKY